jgi:uncharacterized Zn finger protein
MSGNLPASCPNCGSQETEVLPRAELSQTHITAQCAKCSAVFSYPREQPNGEDDAH